MATQSPPATPAMSQDSTVFGIDSSIILDNAKSIAQQAAVRVKTSTTTRDIFIFLVAFRIVNALTVETFFQPDEFFQSLEPAWEIAFGANSGAWITWEWKHHLRSALHPGLFAIVYWIAAGLSWILRLSPTLRANVLIAAPKIAQALCAASGDFYTWKLGERVFGAGSNEAWAALTLTVLNPWQWFCSTRTLSNCVETTLTVIALNYWPWHLSIKDRERTMEKDSRSPDPKDDDYVHVGEGSPRVSETAILGQPDEPQNGLDLTFGQNVQRIIAEHPLRVCLLLAALACILRPTNIMIWICFLYFATLRMTMYGWFIETRWIDSPVWVNITTLEFLPGTKNERYEILWESFVCGSTVLVFSLLIDLLYYQQLTFPPFRFLYFNIAQSLAVFYGQNRRDYYLTEGLPLLLTTYLPFGILGICHGLSQSSQESTLINTSTFTRNVKYQLAATCIVVPTVLSLISHKEVRFIYPLLPILHILASTPFTTFFLPAVSPAVPRHATQTFRRILLALLLTLNITIAFLSTTSHQPAPINVMAYLRRQHATHYLSQPPPFTLSPAPSTMTVGFLMPCHSTPWRSHLVFPSIKAWALGCEPPVHLNKTERANYVDEADQFYASPKTFLKETLGQPPQPRRKASTWWWPFGRSRPTDNSSPKKGRNGFGREEMVTADAWDGRPGKKAWPDYLAFFEEKEGLLKEVAKGSAYRECWRGWNSWGHDDWRRRGDMIVWCLRSQKEKRKGWGGGWWK